MGMQDFYVLARIPNCPLEGFSRGILWDLYYFEVDKNVVPLDLCFGYLDDVVLVGREEDVLRALRALMAAATEIGLIVQPSKYESGQIIGSFSYVDPVNFPAGFLIRDLGNFDLLGAAIGTPAHCNQFTLDDKVAKSSTCLESLVDLLDPQSALLLLRHTASFCMSSSIFKPQILNPKTLNF